MSSLTRIGSYLALLVAFVIGAQFLQSWLQRQTRAQARLLNQAAIETQRHRFERLLVARSLTADSTPEEFQNAAASASLTLELRSPRSPTEPAPDPARLFFEHTLSENLVARVWVPTPSAARLLSVYQRVTAGLLLLAPVLFGFGLLIAGIGRRGAKDERGSRPPWPAARAEAVGLEKLAKLSHERTQALALEQDARQRAEENLQVNRTMLDQSLDERVRLGRELHDNICQTLYAVCLTLESVRKKNSLAPELGDRVDQCMRELKRVNQEVRAYLRELEPDKIREHSFEGALQSLIDSFAARDGVRIESRIEPGAVAQIPSAQVAEIMNILREAVSNALRHGRATEVAIRAASNDKEIALSIHDNGAGFAPAARDAAHGHGLGNMRQRAAELGGELQIDSAPGKGTRVLLTLPVASLA